MQTYSSAKFSLGKKTFKVDFMLKLGTSFHDKGQIISECPLEILDFPKIPRKI